MSPTFAELTDSIHQRLQVIALRCDGDPTIETMIREIVAELHAHGELLGIGPRLAIGYDFVAVHQAVMLGQDCVARARSKTMAKRIARALNEHIPNSEGI
jgi:hypothetical protein